MQRRFRQLLSSLREQSSVRYAKVATMGGFCDVEHIVVKATTPDDLPLPDRYVGELLTIFSISPSSFRAFSVSFSRRFNKTRCWRVALKCLLLLHRLLRSVPEDTPFRSELAWARSSAAVSLHPCRFEDASSASQSHSYTHFVRSYAQLLDEALDSFSIDFKAQAGEEEERTREVAQMLEVLPQLQSLMDRAMGCRPEGIAARNPTVQAAMRQIVRDSFTCYATFRREMVVVLESLFQMPYRNCIAAFGIYKKAAAQATELAEFYEWCKGVGLCGVYEYPFIDRIPQIQIQALDTFLNGMWQLTDSEEDTKWEKFQEEERALIVWEEETSHDNNDQSWEDLLEAAVNLYSTNDNDNNSSMHMVLYTNDSTAINGDDDWKIQLYNNPSTPTYYHSGNPLYPWGL